MDDLQWADSASLKLIKLLMSELKIGYLLLIGAYRDNEVFPAHPLTQTLAEISKSHTEINTIILNPLNEIELKQLVADSLNCSLEIAQPLTKLIHKKTEGNPFFSRQFLKTLSQDKLLKFDLKLGIWQCDMVEVHQKYLTNNVVEFMLLQLHKLPETTQNLLKLAACIGNQFDLKILAIISEQSEAQTEISLWTALQEELILPQNQIYKFYAGEEIPDTAEVSPILIYKFFHDRIQQAAYSLIPEHEKQATHLKIGQLLFQQTSGKYREEKIFEIVNNLNIGIPLIIQSDSRYQLAQLNLLVAQKTKLATAYEATIAYLQTGIALLPENSWQHGYKLTLELYNLAIETAFLTGRYEQMETWAEIVFANTRILLDQIKAYKIKILACIAQKKSLGGVQIGLQVFNLLGYSLPENPTEIDIQQALVETESLLTKVGIANLINLPKMTNLEALAVIQIGYTWAPAAYIAGSKFFLLNALLEIRISIQYGNSPLSAAAYAHYGIVLCGVIGDIASGYEFGILALKLAEQIGNKGLLAKISVIAGGLILPWQVHPKKTLALLQSGYDYSLESGSLDAAAFNRYYDAQNSYIIGEELNALAQKIATYSQQIRQVKQPVHLTWNEHYTK